MGIKLVIVDDAPFIREAIRSLIKGTEIEFVGEASDGEEAVEMVMKKRPDVVLMDMVLPKKNGIEAAKEILEKMPKMRIVACSTEGEAGLLIRALDAGCCGYVNKPFKSDELIKAIKSAVGV